VSRGSGVAVIKASGHRSDLVASLSRFALRRHNQSLRARCQDQDIATIAMCTPWAQSTQLAVHLNAALMSAATAEEVVETIQQMRCMQGPRWLNGISTRDRSSRIVRSTRVGFLCATSTHFPRERMRAFFDQRGLRKTNLSGRLRQPVLVGQRCWVRSLGGRTFLRMPQRLRAEHLEGLPPTFLSVGALDLFLEEDLEYARRLIRAGVPTELHVYPGAFHGFDTVEGAKVSQSAARDRLDALARAFFQSINLKVEAQVNKLVNKLSWRPSIYTQACSLHLYNGAVGIVVARVWLLHLSIQGWQDRRYRYGRRSCTTDEPQLATAKTCSFM